MDPSIMKVQRFVGLTEIQVVTRKDELIHVPRRSFDSSPSSIWLPPSATRKI